MSKSFELLVPQMNPNDEHAVLVRWNVASATQVIAGQSVATLETTKATFDVEAPHGGYVFYSFTPKSLIPVGARLAWICDENDAACGGRVGCSRSRDQGRAIPAWGLAIHAQGIAIDASAWVEPERCEVIR